MTKRRVLNEISLFLVRSTAHGHSLTRYLYIILYYIILFYFMYTYNLTKTNEISFNTHLLGFIRN